MHAMEDQSNSTENQCSRETTVVAGEPSPRMCTYTQPMDGSLVLGDLPLTSAGLQSTEGTVEIDQTGNQSLAWTSVIEVQPSLSAENQCDGEISVGDDQPVSMSGIQSNITESGDHCYMTTGNQSNNETSVVADKTTRTLAADQHKLSHMRLVHRKAVPDSSFLRGNQSVSGDSPLPHDLKHGRTTDNQPNITDGGSNQSDSQSDPRATWWLSIAQYLSNDLHWASLCDLALQGRDGVVMAHGVVMAAMSPVICSHMSLATSRVVTFDLPGVSYCTLTQLVHYAYHGSTDLTGTSVQEFLSVAKTLGMSPVNFTVDKMSNSTKTEKQGCFNDQKQMERNAKCHQVRQTSPRAHRYHCPNVQSYDHHITMDTCHTPDTASHSTVSNNKRSRSASYDDMPDDPFTQCPNKDSWHGSVFYPNDVDNWIKSKVLSAPKAGRKLYLCPLLCSSQVHKPSSRKKLERHVNSHVRQAATIKDVSVAVCYCGSKGTGRTYGHYHCPCGKIISRKSRMLSHINSKYCTFSCNVADSCATNIPSAENDHPAKKTDSLRQAQDEKGQSVAAHTNYETIPSNVKPLSLISGPKKNYELSSHAQCMLCSKVMMKRSIPRHMRSVHRKEGDNVNYCPAALVSPSEGIYMVSQSQEGNPHPIHVEAYVEVC